MSIIILISCSKENCINNLSGQYTGIIACNNNSNPGNLSIVQIEESCDVKIGIGFSPTIFNGEIQNDCSTIKFSKQQIQLSGINQTIEGELYIDNNVLLGSFESSYEGNCQIDMWKIR